MRSFLFLTVLFTASLTSRAAVPSATEIIEKHVRAVGGRAAYERVKTVVRRGVSQPGRRATVTFPFELYGKAPDKWHFRLIIPDVLIIEHMADGTRGWMREPDRVRGLERREFLDESCAFDYGVPFRLEKLMPQMTVRGSETAEGHDLWVVEGKSSDGQAITAKFDKETGVLTQLGTAIFEDYRAVEGIKAPFTIRVTEGGREEIYRTTEIQHNVPVEESRFSLEASAAGYKQAMHGLTAPALEASLKGIDPGAARAVLEHLHGFGPQDGRFLYDLVIEKGYKRGLEIGTAQGNSAVWLGMAFKKNGGQLITIEMDPERAKAATENFKKAGLSGVVECRNNDALKEIPQLSGEFDFVFMDTGTRLHKKFLDVVYSRVPPGGAITSHNANEFERQMPDFLKAITDDPKLDTKITRTPTGGFSVSLKKN